MSHMPSVDAVERPSASERRFYRNAGTLAVVITAVVALLVLVFYLIA